MVAGQLLHSPHYIQHPQLLVIGATYHCLQPSCFDYARCVSTIAADIALFLITAQLVEPPSVSIGTPFPPQTWSPTIDTSIPADVRQAAFIEWITSYFQHGDLSTRDPNVLSFYIPALFHTPSVFNMTDAQVAAMTNPATAAGSDELIILNLQPQLLISYRKALFNNTIRSFLPKMKVMEFTGDTTAEFGIVAFWSIQDDDAAAGGGLVNFNLVPGINHFVSHLFVEENSSANAVHVLGPLGRSCTRTRHLPTKLLKAPSLSLGAQG